MKQSNDCSNSTSLAIFSITSEAGTTEAIFTIPNHNLQIGQFIYITDIIGDAEIGETNPSIFNDTIYKVSEVVDRNNIKIIDYTGSTMLYPVTGTYFGDGKVTIQNNFVVATKQFSPFYEESSQARLGYVDFFLDATQSGEISSSLYIDEGNITPINSATPDSIVNNNTILTKPENVALYPYQSQQSKIWHRLFTYANCQNFQIVLTMSDNQMFGIPIGSDTPQDITLADNEFTMHAMTLYISSNARLTP
jgi:hypothetical protein